MMLSMVLPCFRAAHLLRRHLPGLQAHLKERKIEHEIIVVDDGSADGGATLLAAQELGCRYLCHEKNRGKGAAVRTGMRAARGRFCILTDADIPFRHETVDLFLRYLDFKEFDVAIGDRTLPDSTYFAGVPRLRRIGSRIMSFIVGRFVAGGMFDTQCGIKGFRARAVRDIFACSRIDGFAADVEWLYIALKRNYDIKRLPVQFRCNEGSSVKVLRHGLGMLFDLLRLKANHLLGRYEAPPNHKQSSSSDNTSASCG